jgi:DNA-binding response OmpR family regulator
MGRGQADKTAVLGLSGARVLVVEDEPFIAFDLVMAIEDAGGQAIGPASTVQDALDLIAGMPPDGAILDVNLPDGNIGPVLEALRGITGVIVHTGVGLPPELRAAYPDVPVFSKPTAPGTLVNRLANSITRGP